MCMYIVNMLTDYLKDAPPPKKKYNYRLPVKFIGSSHTSVYYK